MKNSLYAKVKEELFYRREAERMKEITLDNYPDHSGINIVADDWTTIPDGACRSCKEIIYNPYDRIYYEVVPGQYRKAYGFYNNYCEECARKKAGVKHKALKLPELTDVTRDMYGRETKYYSDGSVIEEKEIENNGGKQL